MQIPRPRYLQDLISREGNGLVKVITGVRRCGKSYLMSTLFKDHLLAAGVPPENIIEFSFEGYANAKYRNPEVTYPLIKSRLLPGRNFLLLDEVQLLKDFVPVLTEFMRMPGVDVYVTGSNAKQLSKDIATEFRGRGDQIHLRPLSFSEFMNAYDGPREAGIREYSLFGGLPTVVLKDTPTAFRGIPERYRATKQNPQEAGVLKAARCCRFVHRFPCKPGKARRHLQFSPSRKDFTGYCPKVPGLSR